MDNSCFQGQQIEQQRCRLWQLFTVDQFARGLLFLFLFCLMMMTMTPTMLWKSHFLYIYMDPLQK